MLFFIAKFFHDWIKNMLQRFYDQFCFSKFPEFHVCFQRHSQELSHHHQRFNADDTAFGTIEGVLTVASLCFRRQWFRKRETELLKKQLVTECDGLSISCHEQKISWIICPRQRSWFSALNQNALQSDDNYMSHAEISSLSCPTNINKLSSFLFPPQNYKAISEIVSRNAKDGMSGKS